ncbi:hypothetical protein BN000_01103 [Neobacillus massiliamazoniensis]|uniref:Uncharacterized protein n=1 Tax=Neobacillus massiliamazoniensis TaxID=1499688 RepID=A0A0U1NT31_9BACI|nr:hypothetical protein BN000_01103 [Neobacillus massiliamazoniensis]
MYSVYRVGINAEVRRVVNYIAVGVIIWIG